MLEDAEFGIMYEVKGSGGNTGRLYAKIKNNIVIETSNSGDEANTTFRIICDGTFDQICFNSRISLFSCKKSISNGVYQTLGEIGNTISNLQEKLNDNIDFLSNSLSKKANLEISKNLFNSYGAFSYVREEEDNTYILVKSDGTEEVFTPGVKVDTFPDEIIKNTRIHPYNGFQYASGTNYFVSKKYEIREDNYIVSGGTASNNSSNIAYFDNSGNYLGTNTPFTSYVVDKSLFPTASYFRFCSYNSDLSSIQLEVGNVATEYEEYKSNVPKSELPTDIMYNDGGNTYYRVAQYLEERKTAIRDIYRPLKIFFLGNSFSVQSSEYFVKLCEHYNLNVLVGISYVGGATLQAYDEFYGDNPSGYYKYLNHKWLYNEGYSKEISNMEKLKDTDFDIIFMQQASGSADNYSTYQPYGTNLYQKIKTDALYKEFKMAYLMPWAWTDKRLESNSTSGDSSTNQEMYNKILAATQSMITDLSFDFVSPNGAAIQNLYSQGYTQNDVFGVGGDGQHLGSKKALFTAGLTLFRTLIPGYYDINMDTLSYEDEDITSSDFEKIDAAVKGAISLLQ